MVTFVFEYFAYFYVTNFYFSVVTPTVVSAALAFSTYWLLRRFGWRSWQFAIVMFFVFHSGYALAIRPSINVYRQTVKANQKLPIEIDEYLTLTKIAVDGKRFIVEIEANDYYLDVNWKEHVPYTKSYGCEAADGFSSDFDESFSELTYIFNVAGSYTLSFSIELEDCELSQK